MANMLGLNFENKKRFFWSNFWLVVLLLLVLLLLLKPQTIPGNITVVMRTREKEEENLFKK